MNKCLICSDSGQIRNENGTSDISSMVGENFVSFREIVNHCQLLYTVSLRVKGAMTVVKYTGNTYDDITL